MSDLEARVTDLEKRLERSTAGDFSESPYTQRLLAEFDKFKTDVEWVKTTLTLMEGRGRGKLTRRETIAYFIGIGGFLLAVVNRLELWLN